MGQEKQTLRTYLKTSGSPWLRMGARFLDILAFATVARLAIPSPSSRGMATLESLSLMLLWLPLEAILLSNLALTPGKWLFGLSVLHKDGSRLTFNEALHRAGLVFWRGMGASLFWLFAHAWCLWRIANDGETTWDRDCSSVIEWRRNYPGVCVGVVLLMVVLHFLSLPYWNLDRE